MVKTQTWLNHSILYRSIKIDLSIINESPLRIGSGERVSFISTIDEPILTIKIGTEEKPLIPGSTLKGIFRSTFENLCRSVGLYVCERGDGCKNRFNKKLQYIVKNGRMDKIINFLSEKYCLACKVYGSGTYSSHIDFSDFVSVESYKIGVRPGIAINRRTGTVKRRVLFNIEYIEPGAVFKGSVYLNNTPNYIIGSIFQILDYINSGIVKIGGMKSRGFGRVKVNIGKIKLTLYDSENKKYEDYIIEDDCKVFSDKDGGRCKLILEPLDFDDEKVELDNPSIQEFKSSLLNSWWNYVSKKGQD